jgi:hypothetical protein
MNLIKSLITLLIAILLLFVLLAAMEAFLQHIKPAVYENDNILGWKLKPDVKRTVENIRLDKSQYSAEITTNVLGLRDDKRETSPALTMLVIGDSFTADPFSGNEDMWYVAGARELEKLSGIEANSIRTLGGGGGGYGSYQELMVLQQIKQKVHPDIFVLQFCGNDFMNNHKKAEEDGIVRSQYMRRPYYNLDGTVSFVDSPYAWLWRKPPTGESKIFNKLDGVIQNMQYMRYKGYFRPDSPSLTNIYDAEMNEVTAVLLKKIRQELPDKLAFMVTCGAAREDKNALWVRLGREAGFTVLTTPSNILETAKADKKLFYQDGSHLAPEGNALFGKTFGEELFKQKSIKSLLKTRLKPKSLNNIIKNK